MTCRACIHWDRYKGDTVELGDCRRYPPRINDQLLARVLPGLSTPLSDHDEVERDLYVASAFPITHESSECGEYSGSMPC